MTAEDRLRDLLRSEASTIVPAGDGLVRIRERIAHRRRARLWVVPSAALATAAAVGAFFLLSPDARRTNTLEPAQTPSTSAPQPSVSSSPIPLVPDDGGMPLDVAAIWPFASQAEAARWSQDYPYAQDIFEVGRHFVTDFLGFKSVGLSQPCVSCGVLRLEVNGTHIGDVTLARVGVGFASGHGTQVYTVVGVGGLDLTIDSPKQGSAITSPTSVSGRAGQPDENVMLRLLSQAGDELATVGAPAGREVPWTASLSWSRTDWSHGAIVGVTRSAKDGSVNRVVAIPVTRATGPSGPAASETAFVGLVDGHVALFDGGSGKQESQLTFPPSGKSDTAATWSKGTLAWVRTAGASACVYELDTLVAGGKASTIASSTTVRYGTPQLSPDTRTLGWVETPCSGGRETLVVRAGGTNRRLAGPSGQTVSLLDVADDGTLLVLTNEAQPTGPGTIGVLPAGSTSLSSLRPVHQAAGCNLASGAAFRNGTIVAFESCGEDLRLARFSLSGSRSGADASTKNEPPQSISVRGGNVLVQLFGGDMYGSVATYADGRFTRIITNDSASCTSTGSGKGCVSAPDW